MNVAKFLQVCKKYNITLNEEKSIISVTELDLMSYTISHNKISPDKERLKPLIDMSPPTSRKSQKRIVGMFSYYSKFIRNFSDKIRILNHNNLFPVPDHVRKAFDELKNDLKDAVLSSINSDEEFVVETDASDFCLAATLNQNGRPVAFSPGFYRLMNGNIHRSRRRPLRLSKQ